jgi:hypothetical protein
VQVVGWVRAITGPTADLFSFFSHLLSNFLIIEKSDTRLSPTRVFALQETSKMASNTQMNDLVSRFNALQAREMPEQKYIKV